MEKRIFSSSIRRCNRRIPTHTLLKRDYPGFVENLIDSRPASLKISSFRSKQTLHSLIAFLSGIVLTLLFLHHEAISHSSRMLESMSFIPATQSLTKTLTQTLTRTLAGDGGDGTTKAPNTSSRILLAEVNGGDIYKVPPNHNRFHTLWFRPPSVHLLTPQQSNHRYLYSPVRRGSSDGIGHSMCAVNLYYNLAMRFNLTYTHRLASYSSLTRQDEMAVERFFGWGDKEVPRTLIQHEGCLPRNGTWPRDSSLYECYACGAPASKGALAIRQVVEIPTHLGPACRQRDTCTQETERFVARHAKSHTVFQIDSTECVPPPTDAHLLNTKYLFFYKYWQRHGQMTWLNTAPSQKDKRVIRLRPQELNIAMHVRRGDFLLSKTGRQRDLIHDATYMTLLQDALMVIRQTGGPFSALPVVVHIYSEGKLTQDKVLSTHDTNMQDKKYYDSKGVPRNTEWWKKQLFNSGKKIQKEMARLYKHHIRFQFHISDDTLLSLHEMISSDIFIGSSSGMSKTLVWSIARGVVLVPISGTTGKEFNKLGALCCTVPFHKENGEISISLLQRYWTAYSRANQDSLAQYTVDHNAHADGSADGKK